MEDQIIQSTLTDYFKRDEVSNSDLTWLKMQLSPADQVGDIVQAYRFGTLVDAVITEQERVDWVKLTVDDIQYTAFEFRKANEMSKAFRRDDLGKLIMKAAIFQEVHIRKVPFDYNGMQFSLTMRCKFDFCFPALKYGGDIKSTVATTQEQFESSIYHFDYDRQRALYMTISEADMDVLVGISKVNFKVFKKFIKRDDALFKSGMEKLNYLAYKYFLLFGE